MMNLFYAPELTAASDFYTFNKDESRHISKVLRKNVDDIMYLTNGKGGFFTAIIVDNNPKKTNVKIQSVETKEKRNFKIHIGIAPTKSNERMEWFLEKATEIGIDEITPIITRYSERKKINWERYDKILVAAMKQSLQSYKPVLHPLTKWQDFIQQNFEGNSKHIAYCKTDPKSSGLQHQVQPKENVLLLIGPEGGFSEQEFKEAFSLDFTPSGLSENRLRTETAGIVGLMQIHFVNGK